MKTMNNTKGSRARRLHRILTLAAACVFGVSAIADIANAQVTSTPRRGGGTSTGTTTGTTGTSAPRTTTGDQRTYLPYELDKPIEDFLLGKTSYTQLQGDFAVQFGGEFIPSDNLGGNQLQARAEFGLTNQFELHGEIPIALTQGAEGVEATPTFSTIEVGASYALTPMNDPMAFTANFDVEVPINDNSPSVQTLFKPGLIAGYDFGPTELHMMGEAVLGGEKRGLNFDAGLAYSMGTLVPMAEFNVRAIEDGRPELYLTPGLFYNISNRVEIGAGVPIGLNDVSPTGIAARLNVVLGQ